MKLSDLKIDPQSLGNKLLLVDIIPSYTYIDGKGTDTITGYRYTVVLTEKSYEKINVRIDGKQQLDVPDGYAEVIFQDLELYIYWQKGTYQVGARAKGIQLVDTGKAKG